MKVIITGGRDYRDREHLFAYLDSFHVLKTIDLVIEGGAPGVDHFAWQWAAANDIPFKEYTADFRLDGRKAGPIRNQRMIDEGRPDAGIAFPGNRGTADMVRRLRRAGLPVYDGASREIIRS